MIGASLGEVIRVLGFVVTQLKLYNASIFFSVIGLVVVIWWEVRKNEGKKNECIINTK
jgi:uncharacterized Tic20 family protein